MSKPTLLGILLAALAGLAAAPAQASHRHHWYYHHPYSHHHHSHLYLPLPSVSVTLPSVSVTVPAPVPARVWVVESRPHAHTPWLVYGTFAHAAEAQAVASMLRSSGHQVRLFSR